MLSKSPSLYISPALMYELPSHISEFDFINFVYDSYDGDETDDISYYFYIELDYIIDNDYMVLTCYNGDESVDVYIDWCDYISWCRDKKINIVL